MPLETTRSVADATSHEPRVAVALNNVVKSYDGSLAVKGVSLTIRQHEFLSLLGPSGCGKTTILKMIGGFLTPDAGTIEIMGQDMSRRPPNHRPVNTVFQNYALFPHMNVLENVMFPLEAARVPKRERKERAREVLDLVHLTTHTDSSAAKLSGGQAQRVALARALVGRPDVLLLDEPLSALDLKLRKAMQDELRRIHDETGTTFVFVTHDQGEALAMSDRIVLMSAGNIVQQGEPRNLYDSPETAFASDFLGSANLLRGTVADCGDGWASVNCGGVEFKLPVDQEVKAGQPVDVSVRPERIRMGEMTLGTAATGEIVTVSFHGSFVRSIVAVGSELIAVEESREHGDARRPGATVSLAWPDGAALLFPRPEG